MLVLEQLNLYKERIEKQIAAHSFPDEGALCQACLYALQNGGKRFRPAIVYMVAEALGEKGGDRAALAVEFFHTASLIADDLPAMDNDDERRGKPALHRVYGEPTALLTTYALIAEGYALLGRSKAPAAAVLQASKNMGILGATGGQFYDLQKGKEVEEVLYLKTGALFELSFVLGWLEGGGEEKALEKVKKGAYHFGLAFQIADDLDDYGEDVNKPYNYARAFGKKAAKKRVAEELAQSEEILTQLGISTLYQLSALLRD